MPVSEIKMGQDESICLGILRSIMNSHPLCCETMHVIKEILHNRILHRILD